MFKNLIFIFLILSSCSFFRSYFNTYYNAKKYYRDAEKRFFQNKKNLTQEIKTLYDKSLEKFLRIIKYFPDSPFLDDAIFYSGMIYIRIDEKSNAIKKYEELQRFFPKSFFTYMFCDSLLNYLFQKKDLENSLFVLSLYPKKESPKFYFYKSKYFEISEEYDSSLHYSRKIISNSFLKERAIPIYVRSALKIGMVDSAMRFIKDLEKNRDLYILLAEAYKEKGDFEKAKKILKNFDSENKNYEVLKILQEIYIKENNISELKRLFKNFMLRGEDYIKKQEIGFELAKIYFEEDSLIPLKDVLSEIKKFSPSTNYGVKSGVWLNLIENEEKLKELEGDKLKEEILKIAESYYIDLGLYKKALKLFEEYVKNFSEDREIPRVLYLIIFIYRNFIKDEMKAKEFFKILEEKYKGSFYYVITRDLFEKN